MEVGQSERRVADMSESAPIDGRPRVLIAGGGIAALEATLALRQLADDLVDIELRSPRREFVYRPFAVGEPYGAARILRYDLARLAERCGASFLLGGIAAVDPDRGRALCREGVSIAYDYLILAPGARMRWAVPGAATFWGVADEGGVGSVIRRLRAGSIRDVAFTMPTGLSWTLPVYELAFLAGAVVARSGIGGASLTVVTPEEEPLLVFGRSVAAQMGRLLESRGIEVVTGAHPVKFEAGLLTIAPGEPIEAEAVISMPWLEGRRIEGIPHDDDGFIRVDDHGRVIGLDRVFAAGDVTSFPVKQGGIATQQADAIAEAIIADAGGGIEPAPFDPVLRAVLWTGEEHRYLYGRVKGGQGETSGLSEEPPSAEGEAKIAGRYLTSFLSGIPDERNRLLGVASASQA
jgi:sulfide:quinone oxidoreductase